jgi:hypothetical protein
LSEGVKQPDPRKPGVIPPVKAAADAHRRDTGHVGPVGEGGAHDVELVFDANVSIGDRHYVPLALKLAAPEDGISLRIDSFVKLARPRTTYTRVITGVPRQLSKDEPVEPCVIRRRLKSKRASRASQAHLDRLRGLNLEIGIALVKSRRRIVGSTRK